MERDTGLSRATLRVWERRYGFPVPQRDALGERLYPLEQVEKLRLIKRLLDQGMRPSKLMGADAAELAVLLERHGAVRGEPAPPPEFAAVLPLIRQHRSEELRAALSQLLMRHGLQRFVQDIVGPFNAQIGEAWMRGEVQVYEEHLYTWNRSRTCCAARSMPTWWGRSGRASCSPPCRRKSTASGC
ncbi:MAG: MerR family transcriptional regulator [Comamonadaceae bacterium]|nr:MerR family transcriptional regulator [Comamonadaceae bacterium]